MTGAGVTITGATLTPDWFATLAASELTAAWRFDKPVALVANPGTELETVVATGWPVKSLETCSASDATLGASMGGMLSG